MGWGAVRDHSGTFLLSCNEGMYSYPTRELAEGLAIRPALMVLKDHGFQIIVVV
jgi:hypothetical protein